MNHLSHVSALSIKEATIPQHHKHTVCTICHANMQTISEDGDGLCMSKQGVMQLFSLVKVQNVKEVSSVC